MKKICFFLGLSILLTITGLAGALTILHGVLTGEQYAGSLLSSLQSQNLTGLFVLFCILYLMGVVVFLVIPRREG